MIKLKIKYIIVIFGIAAIISFLDWSDSEFHANNTLSEMSSTKNKMKPTGSGAVNKRTQNGVANTSHPEEIAFFDDEIIRKQDYFCDLARNIRENCEAIPRDEIGHEVCLKVGGYYTDSRYCGYQP